MRAAGEAATVDAAKVRTAGAHRGGLRRAAGTPTGPVQVSGMACPARLTTSGRFPTGERVQHVDAHVG
jgi:hypothetical protein